MFESNRGKSIDATARQRNTFLGLTILSLITCILLSLKILFSEEKVVLAPGIEQEAWVSNKGVSPSYLMMAANMYLPNLLDLDVKSMDWKRDLVLSWVASGNKKHVEHLSNYYAKVKEEYERYGISTNFVLKKIEPDPKNMEVKLHGQLVTHFKEGGSESQEASYRMSFDKVRNMLMLKEFVRLEDKS